MPAERLVIPFTMAVMILAAACSEEGAGKKAFNSPCSASSDCADKVCHKGVCANLQPVDNGQPCQSAASCRSFVCSGGKCVPGKSSAGQACLNREECTSLLCTQGKCGPVKGPADGGVDGGKPDRGRDLAHAKDKGMLPDKLTDAPPWADIPKGTQCKVPKDCDDGLGCTTEACLNGYCKITLNADR